MNGTATTPLTVDDLERTLVDDRHLGFGYAESRYLPKSRAEVLGRAVVRVANQLGLDYEQLFAWSNSKYARWLCDEASGRSTLSVIVPRHLNTKAIQTLAGEISAENRNLSEAW